MALREMQEEKTQNQTEEFTEEQFLKNLYLFMKKRDTPIERIPNLGFKQIDLFVMFKTVNDLGGYHQVTSHQLWKQVYNTLGGNPRSTSAATCTRRHYEKLLLPYECHLKGILVSSVPQQHQPKPYRYRDDDGGQRPSKRRLLSMQLDQNSHNFQPGSCGSLYPLHLHYPHYYHPNNPVLPPYVPMPPSGFTPHGSMVTKPQFHFQPSHPDPIDTVKEPLQQLRDLAEQYKTSTGLAEPLNLSIKASTREVNRNPVSSFSPPSSSKNPKFLNKPSTLYTPHYAGVVGDDGCETQDDESSVEATAFSYPVKTKEGHDLRDRALTPSDSPDLIIEVDNDASEMTQKPASPKMDFAIRPSGDREGIPEMSGLSLSHLLQSLPQQKDGKMEIEVPLSVFRNWLKLCHSPAVTREVKELPDHEEPPGQRSWSDIEILPTDLTFQLSPQQQSSAEDLRLRNEPSPASNTQTTSHQHGHSQNHFTGTKSLPPGVPKHASSLHLWSLDQQDRDKSYQFKSTDLWDANKKENLTSTSPGSHGSRTLGAQQDFASKFYGEDAVHGGTRRAETVPSSLLKLSSNSADALHLTTEEIVKLRRMISGSS